MSRTLLHLPLRALALALLTGLALLVSTAPAWAHSRLTSSDPAEGASLDRAPPGVSLTFNESIQAGFTTVTVIGPDGVDYRDGAPTEAGPVVTAPVRALGPAGTYQIGYRVVSTDGHPISGIVTFTMTVAGPTVAPPGPTVPGPQAAATPVTPTAAPENTSDAPVWPWIAGAVVLVGGGVVAAMRLGRG